MPTPDSKRRLLPSMLDRLAEPRSDRATSGRRFGVPEFVESVRRDLEHLLNTRQISAAIPEDFVELNRSLLAYGMPDLSGFSASNMGERQRLGTMVEEIIERYEPRLRDVRVKLVESKEADFQTVRFHIEARLHAELTPEIAFETVLELNTGRTLVASGRRPT